MKKDCNLCLFLFFSGGSREIEKNIDIEKFRSECGASSVMIARAAQWNCSIFRAEGLKELDDVIKDYLKYAVDYDNAPSNTKYCVQNILKELQETPMGKRFLECQTLEQICSIWGMGDYCRQKQIEYQDMGLIGRREVTPDMFGGPEMKKLKIEEDGNVIKMHLAFIRASYFKDTDLPKTKLIVWCGKNKKRKPVYSSINEDKLFRAVVNLEGKRYTSTYWYFYLLLLLLLLLFITIVIQFVLHIRF